MNSKLEDNSTIVDYKKRFPTSKDFVEWMLKQPRQNLHFETIEERLQYMINAASKPRKLDDK